MKYLSEIDALPNKFISTCTVENGLKAQKHLALGRYGGIDTPCKGKSIKKSSYVGCFCPYRATF